MTHAEIYGLLVVAAALVAAAGTGVDWLQRLRAEMGLLSARVIDNARNENLGWSIVKRYANRAVWFAGTYVLGMVITVVAAVFAFGAIVGLIMAAICSFAVQHWAKTSATRRFP